MASQHTFITLVAIFGLAVTSPVPSKKEDMEAAKREAHFCVINGQMYKPGDIFTVEQSPCLKYRCEIGRYDIHEEGCNAWGQCRPVGTTFKYKCATYTCLASDLGNGIRKYEAKVVGQGLCQDADGKCRNLGESFSYNMDGHLRQSCTCQTESDNTITYSCFV